MPDDKTRGRNLSQEELEKTNEYWFELDKQYRINHRFTYPQCWERGQGVSLYDVEGKRYLDFESGQVCVTAGHCHPAYTEALQRQAAKLVQTGSAYTDPTQVRLLKKLAEITPEPFQKSYLACSGSEANEAAMRLAKAYTGRFEVVSFPGNYHGMTGGSWSVTGFGGNYKQPFGPAMPGVIWLPTPFSYPVPGSPRFPERDPQVVDACIRFCERLLDEATSGKPAAFMLELIQSAAGVRMLPVAFVQAIRRMCDERGALLIMDEAQTGMGRLGSWWGFEHYGVKPDIIVASKTLGGGVPLSATITSAKIADEAVARGFKQSSSHTGDPLLCAVGLANIGIIERERLIDNVRQVGGHLRTSLERMAAGSPIVGEIRGRGFLLGVEIVRDKETGEPNHEAIAAITARAREHGLLTGWWPSYHLAANIIRLMPPYTLTRAEADEAVGILEEAVRHVGRLGAKRAA
ncbi:MAG: aspartate aminotransferase family protein [Alphaproteobacteria bacterium]|nr:aspartate aminotransferase family protein [Alphaproteobacteria bacterium]